jgi:hypothetical protein
MAPRCHVGSLEDQAMRQLKHLLHQIIQREEEEPRRCHMVVPVPAALLLRKNAVATATAVREYVCSSLAPGLQTQLIGQLVEDRQLQRPQAVLHLLFTPRLRRFNFELTRQLGADSEAGSGSNSLLLAMASSERERLVRVSEDDLAACLSTLDSALAAEGPTKFGLETFCMTDTSQDPDFQGDPINNMTNTNLSIR